MPQKRELINDLLEDNHVYVLKLLGVNDLSLVYCSY